MLSNKLKRGLSFLMAMLMVISLMPVSVLATDEEVYDHSHEVEEQAANKTQETAVTEVPVQEEAAADVPVVTPNPEIEVFQEKIDLILKDYLGTSEVNAEEVPALCARLTAEDLSNADFEILCLAEDLTWGMDDGLFTEAEAVALLDRNPAFMAFNDYVSENCVGASDGTVYATTLGEHTPVTGITVKAERTSDKGNGTSSYSEGDKKVTVTAAGYAGLVMGLGKYAETVKITVTNSGTNPATVKFNWTATSVNSLTKDGAAAASTGEYNQMLAGGGSVEFIMTTATNGTTNKLELYNFSYQEAAASSKVTFKYNTSYGSVKVGEETLTGTTEKEVTSAGVAVTATANSGKQFLGWMNEDTHQIVSTSTSFNFVPETDMTLVAVFTTASDTAWFVVDGNALYQGLNEAVSGAGTDGGKLVLAASGKLPALKDSNGQDIAVDYTIPGNVSVVIPYKADDIGTFSEKPTSLGNEANGAKISGRAAFRTLTVADNVTINCAGMLNPNAIQYSTSTSNPGGVMSGYGMIKLDGTNSCINVTGSLYCYGYIIGTGTVNVASGGKVYEFLQLTDWRGGQASESAISNKLFPFSQYYAQNVEANLVINSGATAYVCVSIEAGLLSKSVYQTHAAYMGEGGLFQLGSGAYVKRSYDTSNDRVKYTISGGSVVMDGMELSISDYSMNTTEFIFALTSNISVVVEETATLEIKSDIKLLPNTEVIINGETTVSGSLYLYDYADWNVTGTGYVGSANVKIAPIGWIATTGKASGRTLKATSASLTVNDKLTVTGGLYSTSGNSSTDKVLKGTGTLVYTPTGTATTISEGVGKSEKQAVGTKYWVELTSISVSSLVANLAGDGDMQAMSNGTYIGLGSSHGNKWYINKTDVAPDCVNAGSIKYYCSSADKAYSIAGAAATGIHTDTNPVDGICDVENCKYVMCTHENAEDDGDCTSPVVCPLCKSTVVAAKSHDYEYVSNGTQHQQDCQNDNCNVTTAWEDCDGGTATCQKEAVCTTCGKVYGELADHNYIEKVDTAYLKSAATCIADAVYYKSCSVCGTKNGDDTFVKSGYDPTNHVGETEEYGAVEGTCVEEGYSAGVKCLGCGNSISAPEKTGTVSTNHKNVVNVDEVKATCQEGGYTAGKQCTDCQIYTEGHTATEKDLTNHVGETEEYGAVEGTCVEEGYSAGVKCLGCGNSISAPEKTGTVSTNHKNIVDVDEVKATCQEGGYTAGKQCTDCQTYTEGHAATEKDLTNHVGETQTIPAVTATCVTKGVTAGEKCLGCNEIKSGCVEGTTDPTNHDMQETAAAVAPTCEVAGSTAVYTCANGCGKTEGGDQVAATGHNMQETAAAVTPTCEVAGSTAVLTCANGCGKTEGGDEVAATGHDMQETTAAVAPTCEAAGKTTVYTCANNCGKTEGGEEVAALGHDMQETVAAVAPTCEAAGSTAVYTCANGCGKTEGGDEAAAIGHDMQETAAAVAPTCETVGSTAVYTCANGCGKTEGGEEVAATGHDMQETAAAVTPTCEVAGSTDVLTCANGCGKTEGGEEVAALGHDMQETTAAVAPTCEAAGSTAVYTCANGCGKTEGGDEVAATGHTVVNHNCSVCKKTMSTCENKEPQYREGQLKLKTENLEVLKVTNFYTEIGVGKMLARADKVTDLAQELNSEFFSRLFGTDDFEAFVNGLNINTESIDAEQAYNLAVLYAAKNMAEMDAGTVTAIFTDPNGKTNLENNIKTAGSEKIGLVQAALVYGLFTTYTNNESDALDNANIILDAFEDQEFLAFVTSNAGQIEIQGYLAAMRMVRDSLNPNVATALMQNGFADEELANVLSDALATEAPNHECDICGYGIGSCTYYTEEITKEPTCKETGVKTYTCIVCGSKDKTESIDKLEHNYGEGEITTAPGCLTAGVETFTCSVCGEAKTETVPATGHTAGETVKENETAATCTTAGSYDNVVKCSVCSAVISRETITVAALGHTEVAIPAVEATCTETGLTEGTKCSVCDEVLVAQAEVPATGHTWNDGEVTTEATCTTVGVKTYTCTVETCGETKTEEIAIDSTKHTVTEETEWESDETNHWKTCPDCGESVQSAAHNYVDGVCSVCGYEEAVEITLMPFSATMELNDSLAMNFIIDSSKLPADFANGGYYLVLTRTYGDGRPDEVTCIDQSQWTLRPNSTTKYLMYKYDNLAANQMTDEFYLVVYNGDGKQVTVIREESIQAYAMRGINALENTPSQKKTVAMYVDMLNYGAAAQQNFPQGVGYNLDNLANSKLSDTQKTFATKDNEIILVNSQSKSEDAAYKTATLALENKIELNMMFLKSVNGVQITQDMHAIISYTDHYNKSVEIEVQGSEFETNISNGVERWKITVYDLAVPDGDTIVRCTIYDVQGNELTWGEDSINSYLCRAINGSVDKTLFLATRRFTQSAYNYFHSQI